MSDTDRLVKKLEETIRNANTIMFKRGRSILTGLEISTSQFNALLSLVEFGPLTMGELCKHLFTACSTATDLADRMEKVGLVERKRDAKDRRVVRMHILPKGEEIVKAVIEERQKFLGDVLREYTEQEHLDLLNILEVLANRMEQVDKKHPIDVLKA